MYPGIGYGRRAVVSHFLRTGCRRRIGILEKKKKCIYFFGRTDLFGFSLRLQHDDAKIQQDISAGVHYTLF